MEAYPEILLPRTSYRILSEDEVKSFCFVRETQENLYIFLEQSCDLDDIIRKIIAPQKSEREVFEFSVFLYGYYDESHVGIRADSGFNDWNPDMRNIPAIEHFERKLLFPLYLKSEQLYKKTIDFKALDSDLSEQFLLSYVHKPTCANYWHFQLCTKDNTGICIKR
jgi:hypothetical protein